MSHSLRIAHHASGERGFSMVEVLVSLIIISVGMLGLAKIQALAYANTGVASQQSIAALEAASMAAAMRANHSYWSAVTTPFSYSVAGSAAPATSDTTLTASYACNFGGANAPCTPAKIAAVDVQAWVTALDATLPNPTATITCSTPAAGTPIGCTIQVDWQQQNVAANANASTLPATMAPLYTLYVVP